MRVMHVYGFTTLLKSDTLIKGNLRDFLRQEGIAAQYIPRLRGWLIRTERAGDVIARAESAGIHVRMRGQYVAPEPDERVLSRAPSTPVAEVTVDGQMALLELGEAG